MSDKPTSHSPIKTASIAKYSLMTRVFHWIGALMIVFAWICVEFGDELESTVGGDFSAMWLHKALGASFLIWTVLRIVNRFISKAPTSLPMPKWQTAAAHLTHLGLYLVMLAMPISGILMSVYGGRAVDVFGIFSIPVFVTANREMAGVFNNLHTGVIFPALILLVLAHVGAALYHQFILKDNLIARMK